MHLDVERIERLVHGELLPDVEIVAREHIAACEECRGRLERAQREESETAALLEALDVPQPEPSWATVVAAAESRPSGRLRRRDGTAGAVWFLRSGWGRAVAVLLLAVGLGGLAYALPGSPLRAVVGWVAAVVERIVERPSERPPAPPPDPSPSTPAPPARSAPPTSDESGISVPPGASLLIVFTAAQPEARVRVSLVDGESVVVRAPAGSAEFTSSAGRLVIDNRGPAAEYRVRIPRGAARVEIRAGGRRVYLKDGTMVAAERVVGADGEYVIPLSME